MTQDLRASILAKLCRCSCQHNAGHVACSSSCDVKGQETKSVNRVTSSPRQRTEAALSGWVSPTVPGKAELVTWLRESVHIVILRQQFKPCGSGQVDALLEMCTDSLLAFGTQHCSLQSVL